MSSSPPATVSDARERMIDGLAAALAERRLEAVTMNDIVRAARTSKRTFYECFEDKQACFIALLRRESDRLTHALASALDPAAPIAETVAIFARVYLETLAADPVLARALLSDVFAGGDGCLAVRREQIERYAAATEAFLQRARELQPGAGLQPVSRPLALAIVGGINELALREVEAGRAERVVEVAPAIEQLVLGAVTGPPEV